MQTTNPVTPLSTTQERGLVEYLEEQFLELARGYKKRSISRDLHYSFLASPRVLHKTRWASPVSDYWTGVSFSEAFF